MVALFALCPQQDLILSVFLILVIVDLYWYLIVGSNDAECLFMVLLAIHISTFASVCSRVLPIFKNHLCSYNWVVMVFIYFVYSYIWLIFYFFNGIVQKEVFHFYEIHINHFFLSLSTLFLLCKRNLCIIQDEKYYIFSSKSFIIQLFKTSMTQVKLISVHDLKQWSIFTFPYENSYAIIIFKKYLPFPH